MVVTHRGMVVLGVAMALLAMVAALVVVAALAVVAVRVAVAIPVVLTLLGVRKIITIAPAFGRGFLFIPHIFTIPLFC